MYAYIYKQLSLSLSLPTYVSVDCDASCGHLVVWCSVLQCDAACCSVVQCTAMRCSVCCSVLQYVAE